MIPLTFKQDQLLSFLAGCERTPSFEEMKDALGLRSKAGVHRLICALQERGFIERVPGRARCIRVLDKPRPLPVPDRLNPLAAYDVQTLVDELIRRGAIEAMS